MKKVFFKILLGIRIMTDNIEYGNLLRNSRGCPVIIAKSVGAIHGK